LDRGKNSEIRHKETEIQHAQGTASVHSTKFLFALDLSYVLIFCHDFNVVVSETVCTTIVTFTPKQNANNMTANPPNIDFSLRAKLGIFFKDCPISLKFITNSCSNEFCSG
jgi:hypothetical protein